jgi:flagellar biosynthesis activator protein FlaF
MSYAAQAYGRNSKAGLTGRALEAAVLIECAADLQRACDTIATDPAALDGALAKNRKVWSILAADATAPDNPLPQEIKRNMAAMAVFIFNRSLDLILKPTPEGVAPLIEINRNLAAGLRGVPATSAQ